MNELARSISRNLGRHTDATTLSPQALLPALGRVFWMVANVAQALFLTLWSVFWMPVASVLALVRGDDIGLAYAKRFWAPGLLWASGARVDVRGADQVDWSKPCVVVVNHQSMIDIPVLQHGLPAHLRFIFKAELLNVPFLGQYLTAVGMIPVDRGNTADAVARLERQATRIVDDCACTLAFAEGTRSRDGAIAPFKKGAFMLALQAQVPIVPVSIEGARRVLPCDGFRVRPGVVRVDVGAPIDTRGRTLADRDLLMAQAHAQVVAMNAAAGGLGAAPRADKRPGAAV